MTDYRGLTIEKLLYELELQAQQLCFADPKNDRRLQEYKAKASSIRQEIVRRVKEKGGS